MQDNNARGFYKSLFSCDKIYPIIKICAEMLNVFASYYVVIALSYIINSVICSVQINSLIIGLVTIFLIYLGGNCKTRKLPQNMNLYTIS